MPTSSLVASLTSRDPRLHTPLSLEGTLLDVSPELSFPNLIRSTSFSVNKLRREPWPLFGIDHEGEGELDLPKWGDGRGVGVSQV